MATYGPKILAIDDNRDNLISLKAVLKDAFPSAVVWTAENGPQGLKIAAEEDPDVILLDIVMPDMDGFEVCRRLKSDERSEHIPVLFLTALKSDSQSRVKALEVGGDAFLAKPIDETELKAQIQILRKIKEANELQRKEKDRLAELVAQRTRELERSRSETLKLLEDLRAENEARKQTEHSLKENEMFLQQIVENIPNMIFIKDIEKLSFVRFNKAGEELLGYSREELLGKTDYDFFPREQADFFTEKDRQVIAGGKMVDIPEEEIEARLKGRRILHTKRLPVYDADGIPQFLLGISEDITERNLLEQALRDSERTNRLLIEQAPVGAGVLQGEGLVFVNPAFLEVFGYESQEEVLGRPVEDFISPEDREIITRRRKERLAGKPLPSHYELRGLKKNGRSFDLALWPRVIDYQGKPAILSFCTDRTEQKALRNQLLQSQKMEAVGTLAGGVAHDFNNLLQVVLGYSEMLLLNPSLDTRVLGGLQTIRDTAKRGGDLVKRLLTFSRKGPTEMRPTDLNHEVEQVKTLLQRTLPKMIGIKQILDDNLPTANVDPVQIEQVIMNLAINAKDAMPDEGGTLTIATKSVALDEEYCGLRIGAKPGPHVLLSISDTGSGMPEDILQHIFEPFFTTKGIGKGTGLGLAMVYGIVQQHGGHIVCESEVGKGTTFHIYLPAAQTSEPCNWVEEKSVAQGGSETILLVDDETLVLEISTEMLSRAGYRVVTATNGKEGLDVYKNNRDLISLVILDRLMPGMGGL
jgi:PAS domain S-box-containing protein